MACMRLHSEAHISCCRCSASKCIQHLPRSSSCCGFPSLRLVVYSLLSAGFLKKGSWEQCSLGSCMSQKCLELLCLRNSLTAYRILGIHFSLKYPVSIVPLFWHWKLLGLAWFYPLKNVILGGWLSAHRIFSLSLKSNNLIKGVLEFSVLCELSVAHIVSFT